MTTRRDAELRALQLDAVRETVGACPGLTAYQITLRAQQVPAGPATASITLILQLLTELERRGDVRAEPHSQGRRWYPAVPTVPTVPCPVREDS